MPEFQTGAPNGMLAAISVGLGIIETKQNMTINTNISNLERGVITD